MLANNVMVEVGVKLPPPPEFPRDSIEEDMQRPLVTITISQRQANQLKNILDKQATGDTTWQLTGDGDAANFYGYRETARRISHAIPKQSRADIINYA